MSAAPAPLTNLTPSERTTYERARRLWLHAAIVIKAERFIWPTLGATVTRRKRWGWA